MGICVSADYCPVEGGFPQRSPLHFSAYSAVKSFLREKSPPLSSRRTSAEIAKKSEVRRSRRSRRRILEERDPDEVRRNPAAKRRKTAAHSASCGWQVVT
jgi:hypothetical protein